MPSFFTLAFSFQEAHKSKKDKRQKAKRQEANQEGKQMKKAKHTTIQIQSAFALFTVTILSLPIANRCLTVRLYKETPSEPKRTRTHTYKSTKEETPPFLQCMNHFLLFFDEIFQSCTATSKKARTSSPKRRKQQKSSHTREKKRKKRCSKKPTKATQEQKRQVKLCLNLLPSPT